ncbi:MAG: pseudouridine synthase [Halanaerobiaceae bacterium]
MERLQKYMAHAGVASRRKSEDIIAEGRVKVNGEVVTEMGFKIDPQQDTVTVDGEVISREEKVYILFNKPTGCVCTVDDPRGRKTVLDYIDGVSQRIYPVGRLDYDTSGLLIITNDGQLTNILTHPSYEIDKTYLVEIPGQLTAEEKKQLEEGVELEDGITAPAEAEIVYKNSDKTIFMLTIHEGRNRQVRRMCEKIGHRVINLKRIGLAFLSLEQLSPGEFRFLTTEEVKKLKQITQ